MLITKLTSIFGGEAAYATNETSSPSSHRPNTTTPNKATAAMMQNANAPAILVGAWLVNGEGEGREVTLLGVDSVLEGVGALGSMAGRPSATQYLFARAKISAGQGNEGKCQSSCSFSGVHRQKSYFPGQCYCIFSHTVQDLNSKPYFRRCKCGLPDYRTQRWVCI